ncbi:hypothetical protein TGAMA5MH_08165 [Trichoderma gamsii]|uniref:Uncharacterized protein n=1 Tax=Trichoderma gamsii TaxID=398673 RepID=A0A2K0T301_9HYPO|nr:hypothetical protein TGAMA5MH_08165 [Trichoderma gamsii]
MAPTSRIQRRQTDVGRSDGLVERQRQTRDASCAKRWLRFRCKRKSLDVSVSLQGPTGHDASTSPRSSGSDTDGESGDGSAASLEPAGESFSAGGLLKRSLGDLLDTDDDEAEGESGNESEDESEDENDSRTHVDFGLPIPLSNPLSQLLSHAPLPLPSLPPNPIAALLPQPPPASSPPESSPPKSSPPTAGAPASSPQQPPPPAASPAQSPASPAASPAAPPASAPSQSHVPPSISIPPAASPTDGISENLGAPSPSTTNPPRSSFSAPLPKSTSTGDDSDDSGDDSDDDGASKSTGRPSSTRTRTTLTAIAPPYETQTTGSSGDRSTISRTRDAPSSFTTSVIAPDQSARTKTGAQMTAMTSTASPSGTAAAVLGHEAHRLSPASEKAVIASTSIGGCIILLVLAWFLWRSAKRKSAGRKSAWPASRDMLDGPRRVSNRVADRFTSIKGNLLPATFGWCSIDDSNDEDGPVNEKPAPTRAPKKAGLLERRLGAKTPPQNVTVNSYGMVFRTPIMGDSVSDILERPKITPPPATGVAREKSKQMAAAHLESARASVSAYTSRSQSLAPSRKNTRISDVSSLSSGFGDGDIIILQPPTAVATYAATPNRSNTFDSNINLSAVRTSPERKSFGSRFSRNNSRDHSRDTYMTNSSEDLRPRFRTVSSWVHQQSRRTKQRSAANKSEDRGMATPLPEQGFDMMMPDGEVPRRVESSMWQEK